MLDQIQNVKNERNRVQQSLEESQQEKCKLLFKLEELQIALSDFEIEKEGKIQELKREFNQSLDTYHQDRRDMERRYGQQITDLNEKSEADLERFNALLQQFSVLQKELEPFLESSSSGLAELVSVDNGSKTLTTKGLLVAVRELVKIESSSREKIKDLEKKVRPQILYTYMYKAPYHYICRIGNTKSGPKAYTSYTSHTDDQAIFLHEG